VAACAAAGINKKISRKISVRLHIDMSDAPKGLTLR